MVFTVDGYFLLKYLAVKYVVQHLLQAKGFAPSVAVPRQEVTCTAELQKPFIKICC